MKHASFIALFFLCSFILFLSCGGKNQNNLIAEQDLIVQKGAGKFKYKSEDSAEAQQGWKIAGECPTAYNNFNEIPSFRIKARQEGEVDSLDHFFYKDTTGVLGADGTRYKQRFVYYVNSRSDHHERFPAFGMFKASIKDGKIKFNYIITKANEGNMMVNMQYFDDIKNTMSESNKFKAAAMLGVTFEPGSEIHDNTSKVVYNAKLKATKAKMVN